LLWSYNFDRIDPQGQKKTVIVQAINYGTIEHWRWLIRNYGREGVRDILGRVPATEIKPLSLRLVSFMPREALAYEVATQLIAALHCSYILPCYNIVMKSIIQFNIWREDGVYVASAADAPIATEGSTFEELYENIQDAVATYFLGDDPAIFGFERIPSILTSFELSPLTYAGRA
jgi:hypothetical protein